MYCLTFIAFLKQYQINNIWSPPGIDTNTASFMHKRSSTVLLPPASKQAIQFYINTFRGYSYATVLLSTDKQKHSILKIILLECFFLLHLLITSQF